MRPDVDAVVDLNDGRLTYARLWERAQRVAGGLAARGVRPGDRVAIRLPNGNGWCLAFLGALFYTSGTTGRPKGPMLTHRAMLSAAESARRALELSALPESEVRNLVPAPLLHVMGSLVQWLPTCLAAGSPPAQVPGCTPGTT